LAREINSRGSGLGLDEIVGLVSDIIFLHKKTTRLDLNRVASFAALEQILTQCLRSTRFTRLIHGDRNAARRRQTIPRTENVFVNLKHENRALGQL
jgi:hypothetical protein